MEPIKDFSTLVNVVKNKKKYTLAVANGQDPHTIEAVTKAFNEGLVNVKLIGDIDKIKSLANEMKLNIDGIEIIDVKNSKEAGKFARDLVREKQADILMKGLISTDEYMRLILDKEKGLLPQGRILSHIAVMSIPTYHKFLFVSDVAVIPAPDLKQKITITNYAIEIAHKFGIEKPKVAIIAATEKVSDKMLSTIEASIIAKMGERKQFPEAIIDGPLALDVAISKEACEIKGLKSPVDGDADILIFPNIESGNVFFKSITYFANGKLAAIVTGTTAPCILTSRADSEESKFYSIALAALTAGE